MFVLDSLRRERRLAITMFLDSCYKQFTTVAKLRAFLRENGIATSGSWSDLIDNAVLALSTGSLSRERFRAWFRTAVQGGRKHIYVFRISPSDRELWGNREAVEALLSTLGRTNIDDVDRPSEPTCVLADLISTGDRSEVRLGFVERRYIAEGESISSTNYYVFSDIDVVDGQLVVWIPPIPNMVASEASLDKLTPEKQALAHANFLCDRLGFQIEANLEENSAVAYSIWHRNSSTPPEVRARVESAATLTEQYIGDMATQLGVTEFDTDLLSRTLQSLWEGTLVLYSDEVGASGEAALLARDGIVSGQNFGDRMGASGDAKARGAVDDTELHYVLRGLVENVGSDRFVRVNFGWHSPNHSDIIGTDITAFPRYLRVRFGGTVVDEEDIRYVLSKIGEYRRAL